MEPENSELTQTETEEDLAKVIDRREEILFERIQDGESILFRGYKRNYIAQNLTVEFSCSSCNAIPREAVLTGTDTKCAFCATPEDNPTPNEPVRDTISKLEVMCPLMRGCGWCGPLSEASAHLDECLFLHLACPMKCEAVIPRGELETHTYGECSQRKVQCEYCKQFGLAKGLENHYQSCKDFPVICPHGCGESIPRRQSESHRNTNCPLGEVTCPYGKYGCPSSRMTRRDLIGHKHETIAEHLDMSTEFYSAETSTS